MIILEPKYVKKLIEKVPEYSVDSDGNMCIRRWRADKDRPNVENKPFEAKMKFVELERGEYSNMVSMTDIKTGKKWYMRDAYIHQFIEHSAYGLCDGVWVIDRFGDRYHIRLVEVMSKEFDGFQ